MKHTLLIAVACLIVHFSFSQNVGVGTSTPNEKLDVNGNINLNGQLKVNGNAGTANQVLAKNGSNMPSWVTIGDYKTFEVYDNSGQANSPGLNNIGKSWVVPAGVTEVFVECWGGGGGGGYATGGGGGAYAAFKLPVTPGTSLVLQIGAGGQYGISGKNGTTGGTTFVNYSSYNVTVEGGSGGSNIKIGDNNLVTNSVPGGWASSVNMGAFIYSERGKYGNVSRVSFTQIAANDFAKTINFGDGGDAGNSPGSGSKGGYSLKGISFSTATYSLLPMPGGGGGADPGYGYPGNGGRIILRY